MSEELNNHRPYTAAELSNLLHNERAERTEELNALAVAVGLERVREAGSILAAVERLASRPAPAVQVPEGYALAPLEPTGAMLDAVIAPDHEPITRSVLQRVHRETYAAMLAAAPTPAPSAAAVQVPEGYDAARAAYFALTNSVEFEDGDARYVASSKVMEAFDRFFAASPAHAPVATEAVAQGGGVDVEKVMALVQEFGEQSEAAGYLDRSGSQDAAKRLHDAAYQTAVKIRALLSASPVGVGGSNAEICHNCDSPLPVGCGGVFKNDGDSCRLTAAPAIAKQGDDRHE